MKPIVKYKIIITIIVAILSKVTIHWYHFQDGGLLRGLPIYFAWYYFINKWSKPVYRFWYNNYHTFNEKEL